MLRRASCCLILVGVVSWAVSARADQFEQLDGPTLVRVLRGPDATPRSNLTISDLGAMPPLLRDTRSALVLARTDQGNPARLLLVPELRKPAGGAGEPIPVLVLERLDTFDVSDPSTRKASRRDLVVFDGFQVDLDTGQVVPPGQGGDVVFRAGAEGGPRVESLGEARLFTLASALKFENARAPQPTPGKVVLPGDFAGRYRLFANGQWSGTLDLKVEGRGAITGHFRSDLHGTTYPVSGQVAADVAQKVLFAIKYPRARQEFEGYLWAEGKGAIAGVASLNERPAGFFAVREGGRYAPEGADLGPIDPGDDERPGRHLVEWLGDAITLDGKPTTLEGLATLLAPLGEDDASPAAWLAVKASASREFGDLRRICEAARSAGIRRVRFEVIAAPR